ncbi:hypothetical protein Tco_0920259 [Tanacetum coccineum]
MQSTAHQLPDVSEATWRGESWGVGKWCSALGDGCVGDGCVGDGCAGDDCAGDGCVGSTVICLGVGELCRDSSILGNNQPLVLKNPCYPLHIVQHFIVRDMYTGAILVGKKKQCQTLTGKARRKARVVLSDDEVIEDDSSKQGRKLSEEEVQEKASTETELFIQEVTLTEVIQAQEGSEKEVMKLVLLVQRKTMKSKEKDEQIHEDCRDEEIAIQMWKKRKDKELWMKPSLLRR